EDGEVPQRDPQPEGPVVPQATAQRVQEPTTLSGTPVKLEYGPQDAGRAATGEPGRYPFTRGLPYARGMKPGDARSKHWTMRQFAGHKTAKDTNERFKYLLAH